MKHFHLQTYIDEVYAAFPAAGRRPVIGITGNYEDSTCKLGRGYYQSVIAAGGVPVVIPPSADKEVLMNTLDHIDALILSGGADINPLYCGEEPVPGLHGINRERDLPELLITRLAYNRQLPILGICRGINVINTFFGGTYTNEDYSATNRAICHMQHKVSKKPGWQPHHEITIDRKSRLYSVFGEDKAMVNSFHRTGPGIVAPGFRVVARAPDGVIEAIEGDIYPAFAFQFHPETMARHDKRFLNLFRHLLELTGARSDGGRRR